MVEKIGGSDADAATDIVIDVSAHFGTCRFVLSPFNIFVLSFEKNAGSA
jgi:hypothetical protein